MGRLAGPLLLSSFPERHRLGSTRLGGCLQMARLGRNAMRWVWKTIVRAKRRI